MIEAAFWLAVVCAVAGALTGNRTAWALLASVGLCFALEQAQVAFHLCLWVLIDLGIIAAIIRPSMTNTDVLIVALFIPAWVFYLAPDPARFIGSSAVVVAQLALCFPAKRTWREVRRLTSWLAGGDDVLLFAGVARA